MWEVVRAVEEVVGEKVPYEVGARRAGDPAVLVANSDRLQARFGWKPRYPVLRDIIATAWEFEKSRGG